MYNLKKGLNIPISGSPEGTVSDSTKISHVGILGPDYIGKKPTMMVEAGDQVKIGSVIFEDKKNPGVFFTSPAGGLIKSINRGEKRRFISIEKLLVLLTPLRLSLLTFTQVLLLP